ncbi:hypothetical protein SADUNF_Sadunf02G0071800 [Salix dunnii]|uniref:Uncharacterized protein n=1 Tax=Salix dunnii TaxID=1413687 RepID=A0A835TJ04_9ROSI|nr:hypothetical protein SADUNF_Sadunf02G0071800 [Salix dunnii]
MNEETYLDTWASVAQISNVQALNELSRKPRNQLDLQHGYPSNWATPYSNVPAVILSLTGSWYLFRSFKLILRVANCHSNTFPLSFASFLIHTPDKKSQIYIVSASVDTKVDMKETYRSFSVSFYEFIKPKWDRSWKL